MTDTFTTLTKKIDIGPGFTIPVAVDYHPFAQSPLRVDILAGTYNLDAEATARLIAFGGKLDHAFRLLRKLPLENDVAAMTQPEATDLADFLVTAADDYGCIEFEIYDQETRRQKVVFSVDLQLRDFEGEALTPDGAGEYNMEIEAGVYIPLTWFIDFRDNVRWVPEAGVGCAPNRGPISTIMAPAIGTFQITVDRYQNEPETFKERSIVINLTVVPAAV